MKFRYKAIALSVVTLLAFVFGYLKHSPSGVVPSHATILPSNDKQQVLIDPIKHRITIVTPQGTKVTTLPDRPSVIDIRKDGTVAVNASQFGFETRLFFGGQASEKLRMILGSDLFYFKHFDLGLGIGDTTGLSSPTGFVKVSYNVWSNLQAGLTYDTRRHIGVCLTVRI